MSSELRGKIKRLMKRVMVIGLSSALGLTLFAYAVDYVVFRYRVATNRQPYGQITVTSYDAVAQKNGKRSSSSILQRPRPASTRCFPAEAMCHAGICSGIASSARTFESKPSLRRR